MKLLYVAILLVLPSPGYCSPECTSITTCVGCAGECHWCHRDNGCHYRTWVNFIDPCWIHGDDVKTEDKCADEPPPTPYPVPAVSSNSTFAKDVIKYLFEQMGITDVDVDKCVSNVSHAEVRFHDFAFDLQGKKYRDAMFQLGSGLSALASAISTCNVQEVEFKLDILARRLRWANISVIDEGVRVLVGASDLWKDMESLASSMKSQKWDNIGDSLNKLLDDWTSVEGGCKSDQDVCHLIDGLMRMLAVTAKDVQPCEQALLPALQDFIAGSHLFKDKLYVNATAKFAAGLDDMAKALALDSCGLKNAADAVGNLSHKLASATVKLEKSTDVRIIVGSADVYDDLYAMVADLDKKDYAAVGLQLGTLTAKLRASSCKSQMCVLVEGILDSFSVGFADLEVCSGELDKTWSKMHQFLSSVHAKKWQQVLLDLGDVFGDISDDINHCGLQKVATLLQDTATKLKKESLAADLGIAMQFLVKGADVTQDIQEIIADSVNGHWVSLGADFGALSSWIASTDCNTFTCRLVEGMLTEAGVALPNLEPCKDKLHAAESDFTDGAAFWGKNQPETSIKYWAAGINELSKAIESCGLPKELSYLQQEANVLGLGNVTVIDKVVHILLHGSDIYEELFAAWQAYAKQDFRTAGSQLQQVMQDLHTWTTGHLCTSNACYIFSGVLQFFQEVSKDAKRCEADFEGTMLEFKDAFHELSSSEHQHFWGFTTNKTAVKAGIMHLSAGFADMANSTSDCHLGLLATLLGKLATHLGGPTEVVIAGDVLKILINAVSVEQDVANALADFGNENWPGVGYNLVKLIDKLFKRTSDQTEVVI